MFQILYYILKRLGDTEKIVSWKSKSLSAEKLSTPTTTTDNSPSPSIKWYGNSNFCLVFKASTENKKMQPILLLIEFFFFFIAYGLDT